MKSPKIVCLISVLLVLGVRAHAEVRALVVQKISVGSGDPLQLEIQTGASISPQAQIISDPERLVIDVPSAVPASGLREQTVNRNELQRIRVGLFSTSPPVTRIVLDLNSPQWYRISPTPSGFTVTLGSSQADAQGSAEPQPSVGWVSGTSVISSRSLPRDPFVIRKTVQDSVRAENGVRVQFAKGLLEIHAHNATLSEVLFQVQKQTGAEIAIPAGTERDRVVVDSGPAPASQVLADLLNGSDLNFVVVGSPSDPRVLRSVLLSPRAAGYPQYQPEVPPATASNVPQDNPDMQNDPGAQMGESAIAAPDPASN